MTSSHFPAISPPNFFHCDTCDRQIKFTTGFRFSAGFFRRHAFTRASNITEVLHILPTPIHYSKIVAEPTATVDPNAPAYFLTSDLYCTSMTICLCTPQGPGNPRYRILSTFLPFLVGKKQGAAILTVNYAGIAPPMGWVLAHGLGPSPWAGS